METKMREMQTIVVKKDNLDEIVEFVGFENMLNIVFMKDVSVCIRTPKGKMLTVREGDWIIKSGESVRAMDSETYRELFYG